jgi:hypothetical protein
MADRSRRIALAAIVLPFLFLAMSGLARATLFTVINTNDTGTGSLRDAINSANLAPTVANTINFSVSGTITLGSTLPTIVNTSPGSLTIDGSGRSITVDGASLYQIFSVNFQATLNLRFLTLAHGVVVANEQGVGEGGAILNNGGTLTVTNCELLDNQATGSAASGSGTGLPGRGGAIWNDGPLTVTDSTFSGNQATGGAGASTGVGGGIGEGGAIFNDGDMTVSNSMFSANQVTGGVGDGAAGGNGKGGAIGYEDGTATVINSTFSANQAIGGSGSSGGDGDGGAIYSVPVLMVTNATFSGNQATAGTGGGGVAVGGAIDNNGTTVDVKATILSSSTPGNCGGSAVTDAGHNISDDHSCGFSGSSLNDNTALHLDPAGLQNNGGPTKTIALESNSEAVDFIPVASCTDQSSPTPMPVTTDQRGLPRPDPGNPGFCDAGAFELQTTPFVLAPNSERLQIARSMNPNSDQINMAFTFTENGFPTCDAADDAFNGFFLVLESGTCAVHDHTSLLFFLNPWVVHTVNHESYGTLFIADPPLTVSARMVELPTPAAPACGEWSLNLEIAGINSTPLGNGPFSLILSDLDGDVECFDITNAIVGQQIPPPPPHSTRRRIRREGRQ